MNKVIHGGCLTESEQIESGSVDLILTDPPYGNMDTDGGKRLGINGWDVPISPTIIYNVANRVLRKNGKMILFSQEPYTTKLINEAIPNLPFSYRGIWEKDTFGNSLGVNRNWVGFFEDILVFSKAHEENNTHPLAPYVKQLQENAGVYWNGEIANYYHSSGYSKSFNNAKAVLKHFLNWEYVQFSVVTKEHYERLKHFWDWDRTHEELIKIDTNHKIQYPSTFNLWEGKKYKSNILKYAKDYDGYHPTQKPVLLLEDLIKTFSNEGDLVVDLTAGSGSTAIACINTGRQYIVIEKEQKYVDIINERILEHEQQLTITL